MAEIGEIVTKDASEIRTDVLRTIKNGLIKQGVENPNVGPNSDFYVIATALGNELAVVQANGIVRADGQMPDTATEDDLKRWGDLLERQTQPAAGSVGSVVIEASATTTIETGRELTDDAGLRYAVEVGGTYADGAAVPIRAISTGSATNHDEDDVLQWVVAPPFCSDKVTVATGGLVNGIEIEDDEVLRSRILAVMRNPPGAGNWEHAVEIAEESSASVQKAFCYPAAQGPASVQVTVLAAPTATNKSRVVASSTMNGIVDPYVKGKLPRPADVIVTTVSDVNTDVAFGLSLPEAPTASPPGLGGGWTNGTPWPTPDGVTTFRCTVTAVASSTQFTVDAQTAPTANVTRIAWLSSTDWKLYTGLVTSYSGSAGAYVVNVDVAFTDIAVGAYIWPECQNAQDYIDAILEQFALMGPGERTSNASALVRAFRHPVPSSSWPYSIGAPILRALSDAGDEVLSTQFLHRYDGTTTITGTSGVLTPTPASLPNVYTPRHIGLYRSP